MPTSTNVTNLKINELTEAQYDTAVQGGVIGANELSIITDLDDAIQVTALPTASADELGKVYQFIGTTDANYTHGYFYECVSDGQQPATYSWTQTDVQPTPSGLPDQTGQSGKFLTTNGTDASWGTTINSELYVTGGMSHDVLVGRWGTVNTLILKAMGSDGTAELLVRNAFGSTQAEYIFGKAFMASESYPNMTIGNSTHKWLSLYATKINNGADIAIPTTGGTMAVMNTPATMPTLTVADWSSNTQTVNVTGVTASNVVFVSPAPASASDYASAGIVCTAQAAGTLTFTCTTVPSNAITVNVVILG